MPTLQSMSRMRRAAPACAAVVVGLLALSGCAGGSSAAPGSSPDAPDGLGLGALAPEPPEGEVIGTGTVMDDDGSVELCLGAVMESYPPQCSGVPLAGWSWDGVGGSDSSGRIRWDEYAVTGTYDGETITITQPPMLLALYDPIALPDPSGGEPGTTAEAQLLAIQSQLPELLGDDGSVYLMSAPENGYLWVDVLWDDGTYQQAADDGFGAGVVIIRSALRAVTG